MRKQKGKRKLPKSASLFPPPLLANHQWKQLPKDVQPLSLKAKMLNLWKVIWAFFRGISEIEFLKIV